MRKVLSIFAVMVASVVSVPVLACDVDAGERNQHVYLTWDGQPISRWIATPDSMEIVKLPNGFELGISLSTPEPGKYQDLKRHFDHVPEMVKIELYDLNEAEPVLLSHTYGGASSLQGFGARGGANRVEQLGDPGILLTLLKPVRKQ